ncbi:MAG: hypothetical protein ACI4MG_10395 [Aristaeellaceae bacterium]
MRCPNCSQWNRASLPRCFKCGAPLTADTPVEPSWRSELKDDRAGKEYIRVDEDGGVDVTPDARDELAAEMAELKERKDDGERRLRRLRAETRPVADAADAPELQQDADDGGTAGDAASAAETPSAEAPEAEDAPRPRFGGARVAFNGFAEAQQPDRPDRPARDPRGTRLVMPPDSWQDSRNYDPIVEDMNQYNVFQQPPNLRELPRTPSRRSRRKRLLKAMTLLLVIVVAALGGAVGYQAWQMRPQSDNRALVTASLSNDLAAHTILIPGEDGQMVYIAELRKHYDVVGGFATIVIEDHYWYDNLETVTEETMTVTLTPYLKQTSSGSSQKPLQPVVYDITIPLSPVTLVSPESLRTEVTTAMYSMKLKVRTGSTVTINGIDMSDAVDETGILTYNATVQPKGDNVYTIAVRSPYCRDNTLNVTLYREVQEIPLDLDATTYTSTSLRKYQITCTTLPGAEVDILSPHSDLNITNLNTTGEFTFYALFDKIGDNTVSIQASYPGKKTSRVDYVIYYLPNQDDYTRKAWSLSRPADYAELVGNITYRAEESRIYVAMGVIDHFVSESPQMAVIYCSEDGTSQPVLLENKTKTTWKKGTYYRIYADVKGTYNGMPWLVARYTYLE